MYILSSYWANIEILFYAYKEWCEAHNFSIQLFDFEHYLNAIEYYTCILLIIYALVTGTRDLFTTNFKNFKITHKMGYISSLGIAVWLLDEFTFRLFSKLGIIEDVLLIVFIIGYISFMFIFRGSIDYAEIKMQKNVTLRKEQLINFYSRIVGVIGVSLFLIYITFVSNS